MARPLLGEQVGNLDLVVIGHCLLDVVDTDVAHRADDILERFLGQIQAMARPWKDE
jgi:hypothetical protein